MIFNRDSNGNVILPEDGWYHLAPVGVTVAGEREFEDGTSKPVRQRFTKNRLDRMVRRFEEQAQQPNFPGLLVDFEHFSHDLEKSTEAAGWIVGLQNRESGLWAKIDWSDIGVTAIKNKRYKGISPVVDGPEVEEGVIEPDELFDAGLTNKPNLRGMVPLSNRHHGDNKPSGNNPDNQERKTAMTKVIALLGLAAAASEDAVVAAVEGIKNRADQFDALKPKYDALLDCQAETDLDAHGITDAAVRAEIKPGLIANRAQALAILKHAKPAKKEDKPGPVHNRQGAKTPSTDLTEEESQAATAKAEARAARISNRARKLREESPTLGLPASYQRAEAELAEEESATK